MPWAIIILGLGLLLVSLGLSSIVQAQAGDIPCIAPSYAPLQTVLLVPKIPESYSSITPRVFYTSSVADLVLQGNERICLASSPDGRGPLKADDELVLEVTHADRSVEKWSRNFYDPASGGIIAGTAQDISRLLMIQENKIVVFLYDRKPDRYSAEPVWLIVWNDISATPLATLRRTPTFTPTPAFTPTEHPRPIDTAIPVNTETSILPTEVSGNTNVTQTPRAQATATPAPVTETPPSSSIWQSRVPLVDVLGAGIPVLLVLPLIAVVVMFLYMRWRRSRDLEKMRALQTDAENAVKAGKKQDAKYAIEKSLLIASRYSSQIEEGEKIVRLASAAIEIRVDIENSTGNQRDVICELSKSHSAALLRALGLVLEKRWEKNPALATFEYYSILRAGGPYARQLLYSIPSGLSLSMVLNVSDERLAKNLTGIIARVQARFAEAIYEQ